MRLTSDKKLLMAGFAVFALLLALVAAGCGGDDSKTGTGAEKPGATATNGATADGSTAGGNGGATTAGGGGPGGGAGAGSPAETARKFLEVSGGDCAAAMTSFSMAPEINAAVLADCQENVQKGYKLQSFEVVDEQVTGDTAKVRFKVTLIVGGTQESTGGGFGMTRVNGVWKITSYLETVQY
ncbi:MAG: hypothetical protein AAB281_03625 [Actinomycetota bacterium]